MRILFICTGNTCRSPMARALLLHLVQNSPGQWPAGTEISSAGIAAAQGSPPSSQAVQALREIGIDISDHRAVIFQADSTGAADLILTMTAGQRDVVRRMTTSGDSRVYTLAEYVGADHLEVDDPYGQDMQAYRSTVRQLDYLVDRLFRIIIESEGGRTT